VYAAITFVVGAFLVAPLPRGLRPWTGAAVALFFPLLLELNILNMNLLTLALALGAWAMRDRPAIGGILLAGAAGAKMLGAPILLFYVAARRWRQLAWTAATFLVVAIATAPWVGHLWPVAIEAIRWRATNEVTGGGIRPEAFRGTLGYVAVAVVACGVIIASGIASRSAPPRRAADLHALALASAPLLAHLIHYPALVLGLPLLVATVRALSARHALLALPAAAWLAMEMPVHDQGWRFGGYVATIALGVALFLVPALRARTFA
jgi:hypothetical protein